MIALFSFMPSNCPNCGKEFKIHERFDRRLDWNGCCSHECECGMHFQLATRESLISAAKESGGDLHNHVK